MVPLVHAPRAQVPGPLARRLALVLSVLLAPGCADTGTDPAPPAPPIYEEQCASLASAWTAQQREISQWRSARPRSNITYHLHIPRTAGRQLMTCLVAPALRCQKCYRQYVENNISWGNCSCLASHHDFRVIDDSLGRPSVMMSVREPVGRVLSTYEFAIEVAGRSVRKKIPTYEKLPPLSTRRIWPWDYLVPFFDSELSRPDRMRRLKQRLAGGAPLDEELCRRLETVECGEGGDEACKPETKEDCLAQAQDANRDLFNNSLMLSVEDFSAEGVAEDMVDNAAAFMLLGISNNTLTLLSGMQQITSASQATELRKCASALGPSSTAGATLLEFALWRLEHEIDLLLLHEETETTIRKAASFVQGLLEEQGKDANAVFGTNYAKCLERNTAKMAKRHDSGMKNLLWPDGQSLSYSREARARLPLEVVETIRAKNWMDDALHKRAKELFQQRREAMEEESRLMALPENLKIEREYREADFSVLNRSDQATSVDEARQMNEMRGQAPKKHPGVQEMWDKMSEEEKLEWWQKPMSERTRIRQQYIDTWKAEKKALGGRKEL